jgi:hypothetical protein
VAGKGLARKKDLALKYQRTCVILYQGEISRMDEKPLSPRYDVVFKNIFAQKSNISILADFLKSTLDLPEDEYKDIHVVDPHLRFRLYDERTKVCYPDFLEINVLEVPKARGAEESRLANWLKFFAAETAEEFEMLSQTNPALARAWGVIQRLSGDAEARRLAEYEEMARWDDVGRYEGAFKNGEMKGRQEGLQEGEQKGRQEGIHSVAENLLRMKMPVDDIVKVTGLPLDEVKQLAANFTG